MFIITCYSNINRMLIIVGVVSLIVWVLVGVGLATVLTMSDVCADPDGVARRLSNNTEAQSMLPWLQYCHVSLYIYIYYRRGGLLHCV